jgi:hypothetical protein
MGLLQDILKRIRAKESEVTEIEQEIQSLHMKKEAARAYIAGLQDILPRVQRDEASSSGSDGRNVEFRKGSTPEIVRVILEKHAAPMHADQILERMGKSGDKKAKLALVGTLSRYAREGIGFKKTAPNTFALITLDATGSAHASDEIPEGFGKS